MTKSVKNAHSSCIWANNEGDVRKLDWFKAVKKDHDEPSQSVK